MHIYAFGSVCRGEITPGSDIDLLAAVSSHDSRFDPDAYSIYSYGRLAEIWREGNPFAWHLHLEATLIYSDDGRDYLRGLGRPSRYARRVEDCEKFSVIFRHAFDELSSGTNSPIFELSTVFLCIRNIATCFSLGTRSKPDFSRHSSLRLGACSLEIPRDSFNVFERARVLCTRGFGADLTAEDIWCAAQALDKVGEWMDALVRKAKEYERVLEPHCSTESSASIG